jgi:hypothetical protein
MDYQLVSRGSDWFNKMGDIEKLQGVVCNEYTYDPFDYCFKATHQSDARARKDQSEYLKREWSRVQTLGFEPTKILGDNPPWN